MRYVNYSEGLMRLFAVLFLAVGGTFGTINIMGGEPFPPRIEETMAIQKDTARECQGGLSRAIFLMCYERVLAGHRFARFSRAGGPLGLLFLAGMVCFAGFSAYRWVGNGFKGK